MKKVFQVSHVKITLDIVLHHVRKAMKRQVIIHAVARRSAVLKALQSLQAEAIGGYGCCLHLLFLWLSEFFTGTS